MLDSTLVADEDADSGVGIAAPMRGTRCDVACLSSSSILALVRVVRVKPDTNAVSNTWLLGRQQGTHTKTNKCDVKSYKDEQSQT